MKAAKKKCEKEKYEKAEKIRKAAKKYPIKLEDCNLNCIACEKFDECIKGEYYGNKN